MVFQSHELTKTGQELSLVACFSALESSRSSKLQKGWYRNPAAIAATMSKPGAMNNRAIPRSVQCQSGFQRYPQERPPGLTSRLPATAPVPAKDITISDPKIEEKLNTSGGSKT